MALFNTKHFSTESSSHQTITLFFLQLFMFLLLVPFVKATSFKYPRFQPNSQNIYFQGNASIGDGGIDLNTDGKDKSLYYSIGRALYKDPVHLYDVTTGKVADFITHFAFNISVPKGQDYHGDGLAFFLSPYRFDIPLNVNFSGGYLGLFSDSSKYNTSQHPIVAIEFDTYKNDWDPLGEHVGIDINSIKSVVTNNRTSVTQGVTNVWVRYNSRAKKLSVYLTHDDDAVMEGNLILSHDLNLRDILPEWVNVGFSATTGAAYEQHKILSWEFNSTDFSSKVYEPVPSPTPSPSKVYEPVPSPAPSPSKVYELVPSPSPFTPSPSPSKVYEPVPSPPSPSPSKVYEPVPSPSSVPSPPPPPSPTSNNQTEIAPPNSSSSTEMGKGPRKSNIKLLIGLVVCGSFLLLG